jgi:hypothetical protein
MRKFKVRVWCNDSYRYTEEIESSTVGSAFGLAGRNLVMRTKGKFIQNASISLENIKTNGNVKVGEHLLKTPKKKIRKKRKKS